MTELFSILKRVWSVWTVAEKTMSPDKILVLFCFLRTEYFCSCDMVTLDEICQRNLVSISSRLVALRIEHAGYVHLLFFGDRS